MLCDSDEGHTPVNSDQVLPDEDLPSAAGSEDSRQVVRIRDVSPDVQIVEFLKSVGNGIPDGQCGVRGKRMPLPACVLATATSGWAIEGTPGLANSDLSPVVGTADVPAVGQA